MSIAYVSSAKIAITSAATTGNLSFTINSGEILIVTLVNTYSSGGSGQTPTSVKWNTTESLTMAAEKKNDANAPYGISMWYITNPTAGTYNITVVYPTSSKFNIIATSLSGTATSSSIGVSGSTSTAGATSLSNSLTTGTANSYILDSTFINGNNAPTASGTNQTLRQAQYNSGDNFYSATSTQTTTTAGSYSGSYTFSSASALILSVEIKEASTSKPKPNLLTLGVG